METFIMLFVGNYIILGPSDQYGTKMIWVNLGYKI